MSHSNHRTSNVKYKDFPAITTLSICVRQIDIVKYLEGPGINNAYCLIKDRKTNEQFKVPLSAIQINGRMAIAFLQAQQPSKEAVCLT